MIFGSLTTVILGIRALFRYLRKSGSVRFSAPRWEYTKCLVLAFLLTLTLLTLNWKLAKYPGQNFSAVIEGGLGIPLLLSCELEN